jgi:hypothetical protein
LKDIENIEDWYKEELNNYNVEPDNTVWDSLSEDLDASSPLTDENISEWYKKEVVKLEERPDYTVWEKLSTKLDTASVWDKLVVSLNRYDQFIWWRNLAFRGTAIFLLLFGSYLAYDNYNNDKNAIADNSNSNSTIEKPTNISGDVSPTINKGRGNDINSTEKNNSTNKNNTVNIPSSSIPNNSYINKSLSPEKKIRKAIATAKTKLIANNSNNNEQNNAYASKAIINYNSISVENLKSLKTNDGKRTIFTDINRHNLTEKDISHLYASGDFLVKKNKNKIIFNSKRFSSFFKYGLYARRIYVGFNTGIKKQGVITNLKKNSELAKYNQSNFLDFGSNIGATVGYIISDNFNLETNINFNSTSGYKREYTLEGISYKENLNLNYSSISILAKKMNNKSTFDNKIYSTNFIAGVYASYLRSATSDVNNNISQKLDEYNKPDFGLVLGIEQDRYISKTVVITPSVRYNQGIINVTNDNSPFNSSRNFSFEFNLGVKYIFLKKGNL